MNDAAKLLKQFGPKQQKILELDRQLSMVRHTPCGKFLLGAGNDSTIRRWDLAAEEIAPLSPLTGHGGWVQCLVVHPKGQYVYSVDSWGQLRCTPYADEKPKPQWTVAEAHDGWIRALAISRDGKQLATCGRDRVVRVWNAADGKRLHEFAHDEELFSVAFGPDGKSLVAGDLRGKVRQWDLASGKSTREFDASVLFTEHRLQDVGGARCLLFDAAGKTLYCAGTKPKNGGNVQGVPTVLLFDWQSGKHRKTLELGDTGDAYVRDMAIHPQGFLMAVTSGSPGRGKLLYWQVDQEKAFYENKKMQNCHSLSLHPDGFRLAVSATSRGSNGNGRRLDKEGKYANNTSPIFLLEMPRPADEKPEDKPSAEKPAEKKPAADKKG